MACKYRVSHGKTKKNFTKKKNAKKYAKAHKGAHVRKVCTKKRRK